jgi:hypothetical protein
VVAVVVEAVVGEVEADVDERWKHGKAAVIWCAAPRQRRGAVDGPAL